MTLARLLSEAASAAPDAPALASGTSVTASYAEHAARSAALAGALRDLGLRGGDRIAMAMNNAPAYSEILFGAWHGGFAATPMNARLHAAEFAWILDNCGAKLCFASPEIAEALAPLRAQMPALAHVIVTGSPAHEALYEAPAAPLENASSDALAWLFYTSGTTGRPKGAMLTHANLAAMTHAYFASVDTIGATDCIIHAAPMSHGSGIYLLPHVAAGALQVVPASGGFESGEIFDLLAHWQGATMFMAPTMVQRLAVAAAGSGIDLSGLNSIIYGGAPMYVADCLNAIRTLGPKLIQIYGQGEAPMTITALPRAAHTDSGHPRFGERLASVGTAQAGVAVRLVDEQGAEVPPGEIGEILVKGDVVMNGYWNDSAATEAAIRGGWLYTGDMGALDTDGYLTLKDRSKDVIISGGSNIYPREVEEVLLSDARVRECAVIGAPDAEWGESVVAFIVAADGEDVAEADLDALCLTHIARFKRPKIYRFVAELPKNNYGKVLKRELREKI
jgi:long-chain acyl-CoA synthetase